VLLRAGIQRFRGRAAGYPPPEFRGHTRATARPVPVGRSCKQIRSPPVTLRAAPAPFARGFRVVTRLAQALPVGLVPKPLGVAAVGSSMVDHGRLHDTPLRPAGGAQRVLRQEGGPCPAPARTVAPACRARPLPVQLPLHLRRAAHPDRTVHGRLHGQRRLHKAKPAAVPRAGSSSRVRGGRRPNLI
jgi:hypothetical protein